MTEERFPCVCDGSEYGADCEGSNVDCSPGFATEHSCRPSWPAEATEIDDPAVDPPPGPLGDLMEIRALGAEHPIGYVIHPEPGKSFVQVNGRITGYAYSEDTSAPAGPVADLDIELDQPLPADLIGRRPLSQLRVVIYIEDDR